MSSFDVFDGALGEDFLGDSAHPEEEVVFDGDNDDPPSAARTVGSPSSPPAMNTRSHRAADVAPLQIRFSPAIRSARKKKGHGETRLRNEMEAMRSRQHWGPLRRGLHWFWRLVLLLLLALVTFAFISVHEDPTLPTRVRDFLNEVPNVLTNKLRLDSLQHELWDALGAASSLKLDLQAAQDRARDDRQEAQIVRAKLKTMEQKYEQLSTENKESQKHIEKLKEELEKAEASRSTEESQLRQQGEQISDLLQQYSSEQSKRKALELEKEKLFTQLRDSRRQADALESRLEGREPRFQEYEPSVAPTVDRELFAEEIREMKKKEEEKLAKDYNLLRQAKENQLAVEMQQLRERQEREVQQQLESAKQEREVHLAEELQRKRAAREKRMTDELEALKKRNEKRVNEEFAEKLLSLQALETSASVSTSTSACVKHVVENVQDHIEKAQEKVVKSGPSIKIPALEPSILIKAEFKEGEPVLAVPKVLGRMKENVQRGVTDGVKTALNQGRKTSKVLRDRMAASAENLSRASRKRLTAATTKVRRSTTTLGRVSVEKSKQAAAGLEKQVDSMTAAAATNMENYWKSVTTLTIGLVNQTEAILVSVAFAAKDVGDRSWEAVSSTSNRLSQAVDRATRATGDYITKQASLVTGYSMRLAIGGYKKLSDGAETALTYSELKAAIIQEAMTSLWNGLQSETVTAFANMAHGARQIYINAEKGVIQGRVAMKDANQA